MTKYIKDNLDGEFTWFIDLEASYQNRIEVDICFTDEISAAAFALRFDKYIKT